MAEGGGGRLMVLVGGGGGGGWGWLGVGLWGSAVQLFTQLSWMASVSAAAAAVSASLGSNYL